MATGVDPELLHFKTHHHLAHRLTLSTLTGRPILVTNIRTSSPTAPGLASHEITFLKLLERVTNGSSIEISHTGTKLVYRPGLITGSVAGLGVRDGVLEFVILEDNRRGVSYFMMHLCLLAPFSKAPLNIRFIGPGVITSATATGDVSVDTVRTAILPLYEGFGIQSSKLEIRILQRSCAGKGGKGGGGEVELRFGHQLQFPKTLHLNRSPGRIRKIKGVAYSTGVPASNNTRMINSAKEVLKGLVYDITIAAQYDQAPLVSVNKSNPAEKKKTGVGFGLNLVAESSATGVIYSADVTVPSDGGVVPEDIGKQCAYQLLEVIAEGGCVSRVGVTTVFTLMAMGTEDIGRVRIGREVIGTEECITVGRDMKMFGGSAWGMRDVDDDETTDIVVAVKGTGLGNVARKAD